MGATFDPDLIYRVGCLLAEEAKSHGVQLLLGPVVCLQRSPLIGRGFEAFGEDPIQSGTLGAQYIKGLQENGIGACIKHYAAHDQSDMSIEDNIIMTQRTLREVHTLPFQVAVRDSNPWAVMTAYHKINGVHCSEDPRLIRDILRSEWKYDGLVLCDWWGIYSTSESINAGMDLEMPGPTDWRGKILTWATRSRKVPIETIDSSVRRVLKLVNRVLAAQAEPIKDSDTEKNRALLRETTAASVVLLKNEANVLPLVKDSKTRYALIGDHWKNPAVAGGGSSEVTPYYVSTPYSAFVEVVGEDSFICAMGCYCKKSYASARERPSLTVSLAHKFAPLLYSTITQPGSDAHGMLLEFFDKDPNGPSDAKLLYTTTTEKTDLNFADSLPPDTVPEVYFLRIRAVFRAPKTMKYRFGLSVAGKVKLFINNTERIDLWTSHPEKTDSTPCFNGFTMERFADVDVREGATYDLELHLVNEDLGVRVGAAPAGGLRLGGFEVVDEDETIREAVEIARQVDIPIVLTGLSADYEYEGIDRKSLGLPGRVDELIERVTEANPKTVRALVHALFRPNDQCFATNRLIDYHYRGRNSNYHALGG